MAQNIAQIRAVREQSVDGFGELILVCVEAFVNFASRAPAIGPWLDAGHVVANAGAFVVCAEQMD